IWGYESDVEYNSTDVYISFLRKKLKALKSDITIKSVRGIGYSLGEAK
ncbi:MAG: winged helix-turn-helix domain-containing protein, partial [Ruminococcus sp.]|nr:winged helix-turn-helix domain-containing protein [Ruminococcus sp.]